MYIVLEQVGNFCAYSLLSDLRVGKIMHYICNIICIKLFNIIYIRKFELTIIISLFGNIYKVVGGKAHGVLALINKLFFVISGSMDI